MASPTSRVIASIFGSLLALVTISACTSTREALPPVTGPILRVFKSDYDRVWRATQKALAKYPIRVNNIETGVLETDVIKGDKFWRPAHAEPTIQPGLRYQLIVKMVRGQTLNGVASTEISIEKRISLEKNFFASGKRLASNGLEEEGILYRIDRELTLERALDKVFEQNQM